MTHNFKVGDLVYYMDSRPTRKKYGRISKIDGDECWGQWGYDMNNIPTSDGDTFMYAKQLYFAAEKNWRARVTADGGQK